ncbi:MAG: HAMP domain-containing histidine kinase [Clostridia bacterium]|nr:HAMP domain-containing histidine kinase [Clostridia bacterium]
MIRRLRRRMIAIVLVGLLLVSAGLVLAINWMNLHDLNAQAREVLEQLAQNGGERPTGRSSREIAGRMDGATPPPKPTGTGERSEDAPDISFYDDRAFPDAPSSELGPPQIGSRLNQRMDSASVASLSNFYTIWLDDDGALINWVSDRSDLYSDDEIAAIAQEIFQSGMSSGRIGAQYFRRVRDARGIMLVVVDARVEAQNARGVLKWTLWIAAIEDILLSLGAIWLIHRLIRPVDEAFERQKQFVWDASHELKTPLAVISANAQLLEADLGDNEELGYIRSEVDRSDKLIQSLLTLARMDKGSVKAELKRFDLSHAAYSVLLPFESTVFEAGKTLEMDIPEGIQCVGDEEMIKQLLVILMSNALKYSDEGGSIRTRIFAKGDKRIIEVFNTGPAIPKEAQAKIFDRFYRVDSSHNSEIPGSGLGLAIAKSIVEAHKGKITVESAEGGGTTFTVTL